MQASQTVAQEIIHVPLPPPPAHFILCALFALTLSACSGSGSGSDGVRSSLQGQIDTLTTALDAANAEVMRLTALVDTDADAESLRGQLAAAQLRVRELESQARTAKDAIDSLRRQLGDARADATEAEQRATEAGEEADRQIEAARQQAFDALRAPRLLTALDLTAADETTATVTWPLGGSLTFTPPGSWAPGAAAPSISGWRGASFSREWVAGSTETVLLYTNIQPSGTKAFWKVYGPNPNWSATDPKARLNPSALPSPGTSLLDPEGDGTLIPRADRPVARSLHGTFAGGSGAFYCVGTSCNVARDANGALRLTGSWSFIPANFTLPVPYDDTEYLYFGMWLHEPTDATAAYEVKWITGGAGTIDDDTYQKLRGTATFNGAAIGKYALIDRVGGQESRTGTFTAAAAFTADFDADEFEGRITDFREGNAPLAGWNVYLGKDASSPATLDYTGPTGTLVTTASMGGLSVTGTWDARLQGSYNPAYTEYIPANVPCPAGGGCPAYDLTGVTGWFTAKDAGGNAAMAGAFAAAP